ncbi:quinone oxidoreductase family protein [Chitinophaga nivalis]|uniref:Zinc-binding alcohol dehydrogenase family protein n=1 Tax=Chitinophaga nivalis TaxID=2991709 RepID=A0ABT3INH1_9BACT|nr:zinc-binding alcohol dehydrogenase family protein [Chitinophaga nivalis]MCW3464858.1 zinc-binding alcohol dehydrogenase family protein [Chitinophaga nivalis]MCW3485451.1 zinc-binding alcohol dehydrogenase family protein [Chitinophaga nivalis]
MKAIVLDGFGDVSHFRLAELKDPVPGEEELLIRIKAATFNPIDYQMRQGRREKHLLHSPVMGRELAGIVVAVGAAVQGFAPGDEVIAASGSRGSNGTYAELMALSYKVVAHKPAGIAFATAAAIPSSGLTALQTFKRMQVQRDQTVFITGGAGGVGSFLIKLLKASGVDHIVSVAGSEESREALLTLGLTAAQIIDYRQENWEEQVLAANQGKPYDWAAEIVGGKSAEVAASVLRVNGGYADITFLGTELARELLFDKGCMVLNISNYAYGLANNLTWYGQSLQELSDLIRNGTIMPPAVREVGPLRVETVQEAHLLMEANQTKGKKLVMTI